MIELRNISFVEYYELEDKSEYDFAIKFHFDFLNEINTFKVKPMMEQPFGLIKDIQFDMGALSWEQLFEYIQKMTGLALKEITKRKLLEICQFKSFLVAEIKKINDYESKLLGHIPTPEELEAGIDELSVLGSHLQLRSLANEDVSKFDAIKNTQYQICFTEMVAKKMLFEYQEKLQKIRLRRK